MAYITGQCANKYVLLLASKQGLPPVSLQRMCLDIWEHYDFPCEDTVSILRALCSFLAEGIV